MDAPTQDIEHDDAFFQIQFREPAMKALVVEDTKIYQQLIQAIMDDLKIEADYADTGQQALEALGQSDYELVCLDLNLPDMDGLEISRRLRNDPRTELIPVILLTADDADETLRDGLEAGITEVLHKSNFAELHGAIKQLVARMRARVSGRVLYVEDSQTTAQLTIHLLTKMGLEVDHFVRADEALEVFKQRPFDIVITDIVLEGNMSGVGLLRRIRALEGERSGIPVLAVSGLDDTARRIEVLRQGANDYIPKPVIEEELRARVSNLITAKQLLDKVREQQQKLHEIAITDQLTGLYNRHYLAETAVQQVANAHRHQHPLSLLVVDLDHFKAVNDTHGHDVGDKVLEAVGALLRAELREGDVPTRFGGEEFVLLLTECPMKCARTKAEQIRKHIESAQPAGLTITASIGVATLKPGTDMSFDELFKLADSAVYAAKHGGRNRICLAD